MVYSIIAFFVIYLYGAFPTLINILFLFWGFVLINITYNVQKLWECCNNLYTIFLWFI